MTNFGQLVFILFGTILRFSVMARPDRFDDEGEMSVPRSSKIQGPAVVHITYSSPEEVQDLQCLIQGSPTPTVIWLKNGDEIQGGSDKYTMTYNVTDGKAELLFTESAKHDNNSAIGNFTCIAANFLGRVQKLFVIEVISKDLNTTISSIRLRTSKDNNVTSHGTAAHIVKSQTTQVFTAENVDITTSKFDTSSTSDKPGVIEEPVTSRLYPKPPIIVSNGTDRQH